MKRLAAVVRWLDRYAGTAVCAVLSAFAPHGRRPPDAPSKILVLKFWEGGLIVMGAPWYRALRRRYPRAEVHFLTLDVNAQISSMTGAADKVIALRISRGLFVFFLDLARALPGLRAARYDLLLDLEFLSRFSAALSAVVRPAFAAGFSMRGCWRGGLHDLTVPLDLKAHMTANYAAFFGALGAQAGPQDRVPLARAASPHPLEPPAPFIVVNFDRKDIMPERTWPRANYEAVLDAVLAAGRCRVAVVSQRRVEIPGRPGLVNLTGELDYEGLAGLFSRAALFLTHDSGPLHIAAAIGCPTVSVFGPETPAGYAPQGPRHRALYLGLPCSPCVDALRGKELRCVRAGNECVTGITPEMALAAMRELAPGLF